MSTKRSALSLSLVGVAVVVVGVLVYLVAQELTSFLRHRNATTSVSRAPENGIAPAATSEPPASESAPAAANPAKGSPIAIRGTVRGENGEALAGASVIASREGDGAKTDPVRATTDDKGLFSMDLPAAGLSLRVALPGYVPIHMSRFIPGHDVDIRLEKGGRLAGTVKSSEGGAAVPSAQVRAVSRAGAAAPLFDETATTDAEGRYAFEAAPASKPISLRIEAVGYEPFDDRGVLVTKDQSLTRDETLRVGLTVHGAVVDGDTQVPVAGAKVNYGMQNIGSKQEVTTDKAGSFQIPGIARGSHLFVVHADGYTETRKNVELREDDKLTIEIFKGRTLAGKVQDRAGSPIEGALVYLAREGAFLSQKTKPSATSDASGHFAIPELSAGQSYRLIVRHEHYPETLSPEISLAGDTGEIVIVLQPGCALAGSVKDGAGKAISGSKIVVVDAFDPNPADPQSLLRTFGGEGRGTATTGADGAFRADNLSAGKKRISASADGFLPSTIEEVSVAEGEVPTTVNFVLDRGKSIAGKVVDALGQPLEGAKINATGTNPNSPGFGTATSASDGAYKVERLTDGTFNINVRKTGYTIEYRKDVASGSEGIDFTLRKNGGISGVVVDASAGQPIKQFMVRVSEMTPGDVPFNRAKAFTSDEGKFLLDEIRPGSFRVEVTSKNYAPATVEDVAVAEGSNAENIKIALKEGGVVEGSITDLAGSPVPRATVFARLDEDAQSLQQRPPTNSALSATTDEEGHYRIAGLLNEEYEVYASAPSFCLSERRTIKVEDGHVQTVDFKLSMGATLLVRVSGKDGAPVKDVKVELRNEQGEPVYNERIRQVIERYKQGQDVDQLDSFKSRLDRTDRTGQVRFTNFPPGQYKLVIMSGADVLASRDINLRERDDRPEEITLEGPK